MDQIADYIKALDDIKTQKKIIYPTFKISYEEFNTSFTKMARKYTDNYIITPEINKILQAFYNNYFVDREQNKGLYIAGGTGTGKTTLLNILFDLVDYWQVKYRYADKIYFLRPYRCKEIDINKKFMKDGSFTNMERAAIYIDDFGQNKEISYMGNKINPLEEILLRRFDDMKQTFTFFSSNYPISHQAIKEKYGERIFSRLQYFCYYCELKETNFRNIT